jgi:hypothetical protein
LPCSTRVLHRPCRRTRFPRKSGARENGCES